MFSKFYLWPGHDHFFLYTINFFDLSLNFICRLPRVITLIFLNKGKVAKTQATRPNAKRTQPQASGKGPKVRKTSAERPKVTAKEPSPKKTPKADSTDVF